MMKCLIVAVVSMGVAASADGKDHNGPQHKALCALLKAAVDMWGKGGEALSEPLKVALKHTIFGYGGGEDLEALKKEELPNIYVGVEEKQLSRLLWCGNPFEEGGLLGVDQSLWPGFSAPHDLLCLCTVGKDGYPFNNTGSVTTLCGKGKTTLRANEKKGWSSAGGGARDQMTATWTSIAGECLQEGGKASDLKKALGDFLRELEKRSLNDITERYQLGEGASDGYPCGGGGGNICVMYYNGTSVTQKKHAIPWWTELEAAINNQAYAEQEQKKSEEKPRNEGQNQHHTQKHEKTQPLQAPRTAPLKSAPQDSKESEQENTENLSTPIATIEEASSTLLIPPCTWFIGAIFII